MMYPILCKVQYEKLHEVFKTREVWIQLGFSIIINWIIAPLVMVSHETPLFPWARFCIYIIEEITSADENGSTARPVLGFSSRPTEPARGAHPRRHSAVHRHGSDLEQPGPRPR
jgi:hypothetical protein